MEKGPCRGLYTLLFAVLLSLRLVTFLMFFITCYILYPGYRVYQLEHLAISTHSLACFNYLDTIWQSIRGYSISMWKHSRHVDPMQTEYILNWIWPAPETSSVLPGTWRPALLPKEHRSSAISHWGHERMANTTVLVHLLGIVARCQGCCWLWAGLKESSWLACSGIQWPAKPLHGVPFPTICCLHCRKCGVLCLSCIHPTCQDPWMVVAVEGDVSVCVGGPVVHSGGEMISNSVDQDIQDDHPSPFWWWTGQLGIGCWGDHGSCTSPYLCAAR